MTVPALAVEERRRFGALRTTLQQQVLGIFASLDRIDDLSFEEFLVRALPLIEAGLDLAVDLQSAYLEAWGLGEGVELTAPGFTPDLKGPPIEERYRRAWKVFYGALGSDVDPITARARAADRLKRMLATDLQVVRRDAAALTIASAGDAVVGYRRVLGPGRNCGLCIVASTQRYHREDLMPIHSHCGCGVLPILGTDAPSRIVDRQRLDLVTSELEGDTQSRSALSRLRLDVDELPEVTVRTHGELGPVLTDAKHHFTGPEDLGLAA